MQEVSMQHMTAFVGSIIDFLARELTQSAFWYQVLAIVVAVLLSYFVARVCSQKVATWEENFSKETISHKLCRFSLELTRKLFFSIFAALFLSLGASTISDMGLLTDNNFNLIHVGYQIFYAWALLVFLIQVFGAFIAPDSVLLQIKNRFISSFGFWRPWKLSVYCRNLSKPCGKSICPSALIL